MAITDGTPSFFLSSLFRLPRAAWRVSPQRPVRRQYARGPAFVPRLRDYGETGRAPQGAASPRTHGSGSRLIARTDAKGKTTTYSYEAAGRLTLIDDLYDPDITTVYDAFGRKTTVTDATGTWTWTYDGTSNPFLTVSDPDGNVTAYEYDASGRRSRMTLTVNGQIVVDQAYTYAIVDAFTYDNFWTYTWTRLRAALTAATPWQDNENRLVSAEGGALGDGLFVVVDQFKACKVCCCSSSSNGP